MVYREHVVPGIEPRIDTFKTGMPGEFCFYFFNFLFTFLGHAGST